MLLGDLIAQLSDEDGAEEALIGLGDLALLADLRAQAAAAGLALGSFTSATVNRYAAQASDEEWVTLLGAMGRVGDPGRLFLQRALAYATRVPEAQQTAHEFGGGR
jgi:hypothetical protein